MNKYIDRAALFNSLTNAKTVAEVFAAIQDAPAADVQEIRRGRWEEHIINNIYCEGGVAIRLTCPVCDECFTVTREARPRERFCRWCGARMDEVEE